jgi:hypothetical protein
MIAIVRFLIVRAKVFAYRASLYVSLVQMCMVVLLFIMSLNDRGWNISLPMIIFIFVMLVLCVLGFGYAEYKLSFLAEEQKFIWAQVPQIQEILKELREVKEELKKLKESGGNQNA